MADPPAPSSWSVKDVVEYFTQLKLQQYCEAVTENEVDGALLLHLIKTDGLHEIGVTSKLHAGKVCTRLPVSGGGSRLEEAPSVVPEPVGEGATPRAPLPEVQCVRGAPETEAPAAMSLPFKRTQDQMDQPCGGPPAPSPVRAPHVPFGAAEPAATPPSRAAGSSNDPATLHTADGADWHMEDMTDEGERPPQGVLQKLIGVQTDLQDDMHVAKMLVDVSGVLRFCNSLAPGSARQIPKTRINFAALAAVPGLLVKGVLGDQRGVYDFLASLDVDGDSLAGLRDCGLYALRQGGCLILTFWPTENMWTDPAQRRLLVNFVHVLFQLAPEVCWFLRGPDAELMLEGRSAALPESSANVDLQIGMKAKCDDNFAWGATFKVALPEGAALDNVLLFAGRQHATVSVLRRHDAGIQRTQLYLDYTVTNFLRAYSTHRMEFGPDLRLEACEGFLNAANPELFGASARELEQRRKQRDVDRQNMRNAIDEAERRERRELQTLVEAAVDAEIWRSFPLEFCLLRDLSVDCPICLSALRSDAVRLPCNEAHVFHGHCIEAHLASKTVCPICDQAVPAGGALLGVVDDAAVPKLSELTSAEGIIDADEYSCASQPWCGTWSPTGSPLVSSPTAIHIVQESGKMVFHHGHVSCELRDGKGVGEGNLYGDFEGQAGQDTCTTVRIKYCGPHELEVAFRTKLCRDPPAKRMRLGNDIPWSFHAKVQRTSGPGDMTVAALVSHVGAVFHAIREAFAFAGIVTSQKWPGGGGNFVELAKQMLVDVMNNCETWFVKWYDKSVPRTGVFAGLRRVAVSSIGKPAHSLQEVHHMVLEELQALMQDGRLHEYQELFRSLASIVSAGLRARMSKFVSALETRLLGRKFAAKRQELERETAQQQLQVRQERRQALCGLLGQLTEKGTQKLVILAMTYRHGRESTATYRFHVFLEQVGTQRLSADVFELSAEKAHYEYATHNGGDAKVELVRRQGGEVPLDSPAFASVHEIGLLATPGHPQVLRIQRGAAGNLTVSTRPALTALHIKKETSVLVFNEALRMLAASAVDGTTAIYAWDETFTRRVDHCAPINLHVFVEEPDVSAMHFLPSSKELCFVFRNGRVRSYDLSSNMMRPRGFAVGRHMHTMVDSAGAALLVLRRPQSVPESPRSAENDTNSSACSPYTRAAQPGADSALEMDVYIIADGRKIKTLPLPEAAALSSERAAATMKVVRLYGSDFLVALSPCGKRLNGWQMKLQTAEQVCSVDEVKPVVPEGWAPSNETLRASVDVLYQVLSKYCSQPALAVMHGLADAGACQRRLVLAAGDATETSAGSTHASAAAGMQRYMDDLVKRLRQDTQKPELEQLRFDVAYVPRKAAVGALLRDGATHPSGVDLGRLVRQVIGLVPLQVARAENEALQILKDGLREDIAEFTNLPELADFISFGLYDTILEQNPNPVVVISSMGKQSTGKSYTLNHLVGTCFDTSGARCTDGVWMTIREFPEVTYVALDFEGLGSFERSAQEDMLLSVFNAAISHVAIFRTEMRLDCDTASIFSRMQQGAKLIEGDVELFQGMFHIVVKDVMKSDAQEVAREFRQKIQHIIARDKEDNFFLQLYRGRVSILPFPPLSRSEFYKEFASLTQKVREASRFESGGQFLKNAKLLMAKIAMKDWTPTNQNKIRILLASLRDCLPMVVAAGCMSMTEDEQCPLLHLRTNKPLAPCATIEPARPEGPIDALLVELKDEGLQLAEVDWEAGTLTVKVPSATLRALVAKIEQHGSEGGGDRSREDVNRTLSALADRRRDRVLQWLEANVENISQDGDSQRLLMDAKTALAKLGRSLQFCAHRCHTCRLLCTLPVDHPSTEHHTCGTDHRCHAQCGFCEGEPDMCHLLGGHDGPHDCGDPGHVCGEKCSLSELGNCSVRCMLKPGHDDTEPHMCGSAKHLCGKPCALVGCPHTCVSPHDRMHDQCQCHQVVCPRRCGFPGCTFMCASADHFHANGDQPGNCFCEQEHQCPHECNATGICEILSELVMKKEKFRGRHDTFDYDEIQTEQNGLRKRCCKVIAVGEREHEGAHMHSLTENLVHYCNTKCPMCGYFCTLPWGHAGNHSTRHGNMRRTYFVSEEDVFTVGSRKYAPSESGVAEMCNMYCHSSGRGHTHIKLCADFNQQTQRCCAGSIAGRRHSERKYKPDPERPKDEFTHEAFWASIGFQDPCSSEDREVFNKCPHFCAHAAHNGEGEQPSFCTLALWHEPLVNSGARAHVAGHGGMVSADGHHFACSHTSAVPVHTIFLIDRSTSMATKDAQPAALPWRRSHPNRLGCAFAAVESFVTRRRQLDPRDTVSLLAFTSRLHPGPQMVPITDFPAMQSWMQGVSPHGGTDFSQAIMGLQPLIGAAGGSRAMVVMLSDGEAPFPADACSQVFEAASRRHPQGQPIRVHTVLFPSSDNAGEEVLTRIADFARAVAGGDDFAGRSGFLATIDGIALEEAFLGIADSLSAGAGGLVVR